MANRLTKSIVESMPPKTKLWDSTVVGMGVRNQGGRPTYFVTTRLNGRDVFMTIGKHGSPWTVELARKEARRLLALVAQGINPNKEKRETQDRPIFAATSKIFLSEHGVKLKPRTLEEYERLFKLHLTPFFGKMDLDAITNADASKFHSSMAAKPRAANFALAVLSKFMSWCEQTGRRKQGTNPCVGIKKYRERKVERYLSADELSAVGEAIQKAELAKTETVWGLAALRLYILTGARRDEILTLKWSYVDYDREALRLPDSKTGEKIIKLGSLAIEVLKAIPRIDGNPYVIVGDKPGHHLVAIQNNWERIRETAGIEDVRLHDLRHSYASVVANSGASLLVIGKLLGHTNSQTTGRYAHLTDDPVSVANSAANEFFTKALKPKPRSRRK